MKKMSNNNEFIDVTLPGSLFKNESGDRVSFMYGESVQPSKSILEFHKRQIMTTILLTPEDIHPLDYDLEMGIITKDNMKK